MLVIIERVQQNLLSSREFRIKDRSRKVISAFTIWSLGIGGSGVQLVQWLQVFVGIFGGRSMRKRLTIQHTTLSTVFFQYLSQDYSLDWSALAAICKNIQRRRRRKHLTTQHTTLTSVFLVLISTLLIGLVSSPIGKGCAFPRTATPARCRKSDKEVAKSGRSEHLECDVGLCYFPLFCGVFM